MIPGVMWARQPRFKPPPPVLYPSATGTVVAGGTFTPTLTHPSPNRRLIICMADGASASGISSGLTVAGVAATSLANTGSSNAGSGAIFTVNNPTDTAPACVFSASGSATWVYTVYEIDNGAALTPTGAGGGIAVSSPQSRTLTAGSAGMMFAAGGSYGPSGNAISWSAGMTPYTDTLVFSGANTGRGSSAYRTGATGSQTVTFTRASSTVALSIATL
jgi:hypothetical protein